MATRLGAACVERMNATDEIVCYKEIEANAFFHDFLLFLAAAGQQPLQLTKTGNLRLSDIHHLGEQFALDIYRRDDSGEIWHTIRSERDVLHLTRIRFLAAGLRLTSTQKEKLPHSIGFSGRRVTPHGEGHSSLDFPLIHGTQS
jgi:hypothetical protein